MATQSAVFTFSLPEDENSDKLRIYSASAAAGSYSLATTVDYEYGVTTYEYDSLDDTLYYKIQFYNSVDTEAGPISEFVYGGNFSNSAPFLAVSTTYDGANYATIQDVYNYSSLTTADVEPSQVSVALKRARAVIDVKTAMMDLDRFTVTFDSDVSRRKYNASLQVLREAEINIALGTLFRTLSDDKILERIRDNSNDRSSVSIGQTSISDSGGISPGNITTIQFLGSLADRYFIIGNSLLDTLRPTSVRLYYVEDGNMPFPRFRLPFNGF